MWQIAVMVGIGILVVGGVSYGSYYLWQNYGGRQKACTMEAKQCADGSYVSRTGPNCEFAECPSASPSPSVVADETVGWQTYKNENDGHEFKYPKELIIKESYADYTGGDAYKARFYNAKIISLESINFSGVKSGWRVSLNGPMKLFNSENWQEVVKNHLNLSDSFIESTLGGKKIFTTVDNVVAKEYADSQFSRIVYITNDKEDEILQFGLETPLVDRESHENEFNQILSTFKFTK